jgi:hypothetical protein
MQKRFLLLIISLLLLAVGVTYAAPINDLTALAQYFPPETVAFAALRTDDAFIGELDGLLAKIQAKLPPGAMTSSMSLQMLLDLLAQQLTREDFASGIRSWLGDTIAIGLPDLASFETPTPAVLMAFSSTHRDEAESFWIDVFRLAGVTAEQSTSTDYTLLTVGDTSVMITDAAVLVSVEIADLDAVLTNATSSNLTGNTKFNETLSLLPQGDYSMAAYLDVERFGGFYANTIGASPDEIAGLDRLISAYAMGITLLDGEALLLDVALNVGDWGVMTQFSDLSGLTIPQIGAIDPAFARFIPADATFALHSTNLKDIVDLELGLASFVLISNMRGGSDLSPREQIAQSRERLVAQFTAMTGLDLDDDVLSWMGGDYTLFGRIEGDAMMAAIEQNLSGGTLATFEQVPFGGGLVIEATDPAKAQAFVAAVGSLAMQSAAPQMTISQDQINGVSVTVITQPVGEQVVPPLEIVIGANDSVFFAATRPDAEIILSGIGGLDTSQAYQDAVSLALVNPSALLYASPESVRDFAILGGGLLVPTRGDVFCNIVGGLNEATPVVQPTEDPQCQAMLQQIDEENQRAFESLQNFINVAALFSGGTMSVAATPEGDALARLVVQLGE